MKLLFKKYRLKLTKEKEKSMTLNIKPHGKKSITFIDSEVGEITKGQLVKIFIDSYFFK